MNDDIGVNRSAVVPRTSWCEDRIGFISYEGNPVIGNRVTDGILREVAVRLVEQVDSAVQYNRAWRAKAVRLAVLLRCNLADTFPLLQVLAGSDTDGQAILFSSVTIGGDGVIHPILAIKFNDCRILRESSSSRGVCKIHHGAALTFSMFFYCFTNFIISAERKALSFCSAYHLL
ncbi:hypothetical protein D3C85_1283100 [compost metagenome]